MQVFDIVGKLTTSKIMIYKENISITKYFTQISLQRKIAKIQGKHWNSEKEHQVWIRFKEKR